MRNKIEQAIYDTELRLNDVKDRSRMLLTEIKVLEDQLDTLKVIQKNDKIPNQSTPAKEADQTWKI